MKRKLKKKLWVLILTLPKTIIFPLLAFWNNGRSLSKQVRVDLGHLEISYAPIYTDRMIVQTPFLHKALNEVTILCCLPNVCNNSFLVVLVAALSTLLTFAGGRPQIWFDISQNSKKERSSAYILICFSAECQEVTLWSLCKSLTKLWS